MFRPPSLLRYLWSDKANHGGATSKYGTTAAFGTTPGNSVSNFKALIWVAPFSFELANFEIYLQIEGISMTKENEASSMEIDDQNSIPSDQIDNPKFSINGTVHMELYKNSCLNHLIDSLAFYSVAALEIISDATWYAIWRLRSLPVWFYLSYSPVVYTCLYV